MEKPRGDLEKVPPREDLKLRDVPKANPRALFHNLSDFGFLEVQGSLPRDNYGKILVNPQ